MSASLYRYHGNVLLADYARAGAGMAICFAPLLFVEEASLLVWILFAAGALFTVFAARTALRHATRVELSPQGLRLAGPLPRGLAWRDLEAMKLAYFSTRRDRTKGWMELKLRGAGTSLAVDSSLDGFDAVVESALSAARSNGVELSDVTRANLDAMGFAVSTSAQPDDHL